MSVLDPLRDVAARVDARTRRERLLIAGAVLALMLVVWEFAVRAPIAGADAAARDRIARTRGDIERLQQSTTKLASELQAVQGGADNAAEQKLRERLASIDAELGERTARVVSPQQMVAVLRDMLEADPKLTLIGLHNAGVEPVVTEERAASGKNAGDNAGGDVPRVFRHRVEVVVEGSYFDLLGYLERLEGLRWQFQWDGLRIETVDYPRARATVSLSTLSLAEDWIGV